MKRLISDAVQIRPAISELELLTPEVNISERLRANLPSEAEVRDAAQKLARQIKDTIDARTQGEDGWVIGDLTVTVVEHDMGESVLRGWVIIERAD